jgi:CRISPR-associated protein Csm5
MQTYDATITVLSPLHIGSGEQPDRKSRWLQEGRVWLVDEQALFQAVAESPQLLDRFERFSLEPRQSLLTFLERARIDPKSVALYSLRQMGNRPGNYYFSCIKIPGRPPRPYIPGSSLKGALRSAVLRSEILKDETTKQRAAGLIQQQMRGRRPNAKRADDALEQAVFGKDQHHEWTRLIQIADTQPVPTTRLWATEVHILSVRGTPPHYHLEEKTIRRGRPLALYPEILRPGTKLDTRMTIQDELLSSLAAPELRFPKEYGTIEAWLKACNRTTKNLITQEWTFARDTDWQEGQKFYGWLLDQLIGARRGKGCLLRLGWGAGYDDKTVTDLMDDDFFRDVLDGYGLSVGRPYRDRRRPPLPKPFAPKSRSVAFDHRGRQVPLGWIRIEIGQN